MIPHYLLIPPPAPKLCIMHRLPLHPYSLRSWPSPRPALSSSTQSLVDKGVTPSSRPSGGPGLRSGEHLPKAPTAAALRSWHVATTGSAEQSSSSSPPAAHASGHPRRDDIQPRRNPRKRKLEPDTVTDALRRLDEGKYTPSSRRSVKARVAWWQREARRLGTKPWPLTKGSLRIAAAALKAGAFRSASQYLYCLKKTHIRKGHAWNVSLGVEMLDCIRSCTRGIGPPKRAAPLPLDRLQLPFPAPCALLGGTDSILIGCWWLLREVELAGLMKSDITLLDGDGCGVASLNIALSKCDHTAKGAHRKLSCVCPRPLCPVAAVRRVLATVDGEARGSYVIRNLEGAPATKAEAVQEIRHLGRHLGITAGLSGHSMRVTGAQRLARAGVSEGRISLFGRWASNAMLVYVREALLEAAGRDIAHQVAATSSSDLQALVARCADTATPEARAHFTANVVTDPWTSTTEIDVGARWAEYNTDVATSSSIARPALLPAKVASRGGLVHAVRTCHYTACGWHWSATGEATLMSAEVVTTCRKCAGTSIRWAGSSVSPAPPVDTPAA